MRLEAWGGALLSLLCAQHGLKGGELLLNGLVFDVLGQLIHWHAQHSGHLGLGIVHLLHDHGILLVVLGEGPAQDWGRGQD